MTRTFTVLLALGVASLAFAAVRAAHHDRGVATTTSPRPVALTEGGVPLADAHLRERSRVVVEACSAALRTGAPAPVGLAFQIVDVASGRVRVDAPVREADLATVRRGPAYGCFLVGSIEALPLAGHYGLVGRSASALPPFVGRIVTRAPLESIDIAALVSLAVVVTLTGFALVAHRRRREREAAAAQTASGSLPTAGLALASLVLGLFAASTVSVPGALGAILRGAIVLAAQLVPIAVATHRRGGDVNTVVSTGNVTHLGRWVAGALALGLVVRAASSMFDRLLPKLAITEVEKIVNPSLATPRVETAIDPLGGAIAFGAVALVAPLVEELFFRGLVYGELERAKGARLAGFVAFATFVVCHLPQAWGRPAAVASIALLSLVATLLRARTGGTLVPATMHTAHNAVIVALAFATIR